MKIPVIITDFFTIYTEAVQDDVFIHMDVLKWNKKIRSQFITEWNDWANKQGRDLFGMPFIDNDKMVKWSKVCGFDLFDNYTCTDGVVRKLYIWRNTNG